MNTPKPSKFQFRIDAVLTALFLAALVFMGAMTLLTDHEGIFKAAVSKSRLSGYLEQSWEDSSPWDRLCARIRSVDDYIAGNVYGATELGYVNSSVQYAMGKRLVTTGASQMLTLDAISMICRTMSPWTIPPPMCRPCAISAAKFPSFMSMSIPPSIPPIRCPRAMAIWIIPTKWPMKSSKKSPG